MVAKRIEAIYPASPVQEALLSQVVGAQTADQGCGLLTCVVRGKLDLAILESAWDQIVDRHAILRTSFAWKRVDKPVQVVHMKRGSFIGRLDWRQAPVSEQGRLLKESIDSELRKPFNPAEAEAVRLYLYQTADEEANLVCSYSRLLLDDRSAGLLLRELFVLYDGLCGEQYLRSEQTPPYRDYIAWLTRQDEPKAEAFWRMALEGFSNATALAGTLPSGRRSSVEDEYGQRQVRLMPDAVARARAVEAETGFALATLLHGAWALLLSRYSGEEQVTFGITVSSRSIDARMANSLGPLTNTLPALVKVCREKVTWLWLEELRTRQAGLRQYGYCSSAQIRKWIGQPEDGPLFESRLILDGDPVDPFSCRTLKTLRISEIQNLGLRESPLGLEILSVPEGLARIIYHRRSFDDAIIEQMVRHLEAVLEGMSAGLEVKLEELPFLSRAERQELLVEWNRTEVDYPREKRVHELFEAQAEMIPDAIALAQEDKQLSYAELNVRANRLAHFLRRLGVGPETRVGICLERSCQLVLAIYAVLKAGGAYVPLDPEYPERRLAYQVADAGIGVIITERRWEHVLPPTGARLLCLDEQWDEISRSDDWNPDSRLNGENLAYVIYTSGSTGEPKGAMNTHAGILNRIQWMQQAYGLDHSDCVMQKTPYSFDVSVWEFLWPLTSGARLAVARPGGHRESRYLVELIEQEQVTTLHFVPAMLSAFLEEEGLERCCSVRRVICSGEELSRTLQERYWVRMEARLENLYGPTEAAVDVTQWRCERGGERAAVPIGRPIANTEIYILDERLEPSPVGVAGEIYIGGVGVARGYVSRPELTAERFVAHPHSMSPGRRVYKTGDAGRYLADGAIEFLGRRDRQVKVRGFRIELGEVEAALGEQEGVRQAIVEARDGAAGQKRLVAYVALREGANVEDVELREKLREKLPEYMIPSVWVRVIEFPLTGSGKVDRRKLPEPGVAWQGEGQAYEGPRTAAEDELVKIWTEVLRIERVGVHDNFFALGGDSILSIQIISRANEAGLGLTVKQLFERQTIAELAAVAGEQGMIESEPEEVAGEVPLTPIQEWFFEGNYQEPEHFNQAVMLEAREGIDIGALDEVIRQLIKQHDALRHRFHQTEGGWRQICEGPGGTVALEEVDLSSEDEASESKVIEEAAERYQKGINLAEGPLVRVVVFNGGKGRRPRLLVIAHHLVTDGVSWRILLRDIERGYEQIRRRGEVKLGIKTTSYKRWAERLKKEAQTEKARQEARYWLAEEGKNVRGLPVDKTGANTGASIRIFTRSLDREETARLLREVAGICKAQVNEVLLCAVARSVSEWSREQTVLLEMEGHGREEIFEDVNLTRTVGWFTSWYPVRVEVKTTNHLDLLRDVKEQVRAASRRGIYYGMVKYLSEDSDLRRRLRALPPPEISFNYLGQLDLVLSEESLFRVAKESVGETRSRNEKRRHLIEINGGVSGGRLHLTWAYSENLHRRETVEAVADRVLEALREMIVECRSTAERPYVPSDFPLASLDRQGLDRLLRAGGEVEDIYSLSPLQKAMLFHTLSGLNSQALFLQLTCNLRGKVDLPAFKRAWRHLVDRHSVLRTSFEWEGLEDPAQVVRRRVELPIEYMDWSPLAREEQERKFEALLQTGRERGFNLSDPPLMSLSLIRLEDDRYRLIWNYHHLLLDGWSSALVLHEVMALYEAYRKDEAPAPVERAPYKEYIGWLRGQDLQKAEAYWRDRLKGFDKPIRLGIDWGGRRSSDREGADQVYRDQQVRLNGESSAKLQAFARRHHLTLNTVLQGAWGLVLSKYSGEEDVVFGTTVSGRPVDLPGSESIIGPFINTLPVRMRIPFRSSLLPWLSKVQNEQIEYSRYAYSSLVEQYSEVPLGMALYESILIFENYPVEQLRQNRERQVEVIDFHSQVRTKYPLTVVSGSGSELPLSITYDLRRFNDQDIRRLLIHLQNAVEGIVNDPEQPVWSFSPLSRIEREQLLVGWKGLRRTDPDEFYVQYWLEARLEKVPDSISVVSGQEHVTYRELNRRANQLSSYLRKLEVGPEVRVGVYLESPLAWLVGVLGVIKAGGVCMTLAPADPTNGFSSILSLQELGASVVLTQRSLIEGSLEVKSKIVRLDSDWEMIGREDGSNPNSLVAGENPAFIVYSSGATGEPRRVTITHHGLRHHLLGMQAALSVSREDRVLQRARDVLTGDLFWPLLAGACLVMTGPETYRNRDYLIDLMIEQKITIAGFTPSLFSLLLRESRFESGNSLRRVILSGEALCPPLWDRSMACLKADLYNLYRVTEASGAVMAQIYNPRPGAEPSPVGRPLDNTQIYLLDAHLQPVPARVAGEVWISGEGLARGYAGRPDLTAENLIPNPFSDDPGGRMFRTGDLARHLPDGEIEVLTRSQHQINLKLGRTDPVVVESALMEYPGVYQAAVSLAGDAAGGTRLVAYLACDMGRAPSADALRRFLMERFPPQMIPSAFLPRETLSLTADDRLDRNLLAGMELNVADSGIALADKRTPYEEVLSSIWAELFGVDEVSREDHFFKMGGHSLLATRMMSRVREAFKVEIPLRKIFEEPTLERLASAIEGAIEKAENQQLLPLVRAPRDGKLPLSFAQQRLWFIDQLEPGKAIYNSAVGVRLEGRADLKTLEKVINETVRRHEVLRTRIGVDAGLPAQVIDPWEYRSLEIEDLSGLEKEEREREVRRISRQEAATAFDLYRGPLFRVKGLKLGDEEHVILFTLHHIVSDAWSMGVLVREVCELYQAIKEGRKSSLPELKIQYADYAYWQRRYLTGRTLEEHLQYWKKQLGGNPRMLELPTDHPRPQVPSSRGAAKTFSLPRTLSQSLKALGRQEDVTLFMLLLAAFKTLLYQYTAQKDIIVGTAIANRNRAEIERLIGRFVNILPMRTDLSGNPRFTQLLKRVKEVALGAFAYQELPFEKLVEELQPGRELGKTPLFNIAFGVQNAPREEAQLAGLKVTSATVGQEAVRFDLTLWMAEGAETMWAGWTYSADLLEEETIIRMQGHFETLLSSIVARPDAPLDELEMFNEAEKAQRSTSRIVREERHYKQFKSIKPTAVVLSED